jgi:UDP-3-O-acyl N-acetylglucosamine deacetylase
MSVLRCQRTLARNAVVEGFGYWSGKDVQVEFCPAEAGSGVTFVRRDLSGEPTIAARIANRVEIPRRTVLASGMARVAMVEHVLAALSGLGIDNCQVCVDAEEMPGCDGSALAFVEALDSAGLVEQDVPVRPLIVESPVRLGDDQCWIEARPSRGDGFSVEFVLDYGADTPIGRQTIDIDINTDSFRNEIATCRTFLLEQEARQLNAQGLGTRVAPRDLLLFDANGPVGNELRFVDECVRHKVLDVVGDLSLAGRPIVGHIVAHRSGHQLNAALVRALLQQECQSVPTARCA